MTVSVASGLVGSACGVMSYGVASVVSVDARAMAPCILLTTSRKGGEGVSRHPLYAQAEGMGEGLTSA